MIALVQRLDAERREEFHQAFVELYESTARRRRGARAAPLPARDRADAAETRSSSSSAADPARHANPPGNETAAAELLRAYLEAAGVECELYARVPERANLVARIRGRGDGPSLAFLSHTDVVLADAREWSATRSAASSSTARSGVAARST